jgi:hypothetical protein
MLKDDVPSVIICDPNDPTCGKLVDPHLGYTKDQIIKNLILLEEHFKNYQCPICIDKHLMAIEGYCEEGMPMSASDLPTFKIIAKWCREHRKNTGWAFADAIQEARTFREGMQNKEHSH